jgi:hypothetical protein
VSATHTATEAPHTGNALEVLLTDNKPEAIVKVKVKGTPARTVSKLQDHAALTTAPLASAGPRVYLMLLKLEVIHNGVTYYGIKVGMSADATGNREFDGDVPKILCVARPPQSYSAHCGVNRCCLRAR